MGSRKGRLPQGAGGRGALETGHYTFLINPATVAYGFAQDGDIVNLDYDKGFAKIDTNTTQAGEGSSSAAATADETPLAWFDSYEFPVNVTDKDVEKGVSINAPKDMTVDESFSPIATLNFTTYTFDFNKRTYTVKGDWSSSNTSVLSVGADGAVKAVGPGTATVTVTSQGKSWTSSTITVTQSLDAVAAVSGQR